MTKYFITQSGIQGDENIHHQILTIGDETLLLLPNIKKKKNLLSLVTKCFFVTYKSQKSKMPIQNVKRERQYLLTLNI